MKICAILVLTVLQLVILTSAAAAQSFIENTGLIDVYVGSERSETVSRLRSGGYELADGTDVRFDRWYSSNWRDLSFSFLTEITPGFGLIWGLSTGERGEKYRIAPALEVGLMLQIDLSRNSTLTFSARTKLGGLLQEQTCTADYGAIGGVQRVNCRMAASPLAPADTLDYLIHMHAVEESTVSVVYELRF